ncbi:hypothetical protein DCAR_0729532 [Daucus carota subsp. sativus]|uniref:Uncharacterized protein n=1 Tax=Daucus carota subsp. sativus TaxID=79200 RepID=A0AAF1BBC0_DAUCS|nr:hypothetical protein DCAR_0729532 [Daucus carota subsp. sativus]
MHKSHNQLRFFCLDRFLEVPTKLVYQELFKYMYISRRSTGYYHLLARDFLLKCTGLDKIFKSMMIKDQVMITSQKSGGELLLFWDLEEENAAEVCPEFGLLFEALAEGLKSRHAKLHSA